MSNRKNAARTAVNPRWAILVLAVTALATALGVMAIQSTRAADLVVYKSPTCGCCDKWVEHMQDAGFSVEPRDRVDLDPVKAEHGIARHLQSCHTAVIDGYVVEGHVPADLVRRMLDERPDIRGLAVPGMPMGSPGMEGPYTERYDVLAIGSDGRTQVYDRR